MCVRYNADIIASIIFGLETDSFTNRNNDYIFMAEDLFGHYSRWRMLKFILLVMAPQLLENFNFRTVQEKQEAFITKIIKEVVSYRESEGIRRNDIMQILIDLKNNSNQHTLELSIQDLAAQAYTYFFAGFESTSKTMNFLLYHCALDQDIQRKIQHEIDECTNFSEGITYENISNMQYLNQAISGI